MGNGRQARQNSIAEFWCEVREFLFCFSFLASTPGLHRKKCKACQDDNHFNSKECKRCGGALDILSKGTTASASDGYGESVVHVTCSCGYE